MPKIKNWSFVGNVGPMGEAAWQHDITGDLKVDIENYDIGEWCITYFNGKENVSIGDATNEADARKIAVEWMRSHPDGGDMNGCST